MIVSESFGDMTLLSDSQQRFENAGESVTMAL